jgi:hypothetical protein
MFFFYLFDLYSAIHSKHYVYIISPLIELLRNPQSYSNWPSKDKYWYHVE